MHNIKTYIKSICCITLTILIFVSCTHAEVLEEDNTESNETTLPTEEVLEIN